MSKRRNAIVLAEAVRECHAKGEIPTEEANHWLGVARRWFKAKEVRQTVAPMKEAAE